MNNTPVPKPEAFGHYIDDCFGATSCCRTDQEAFFAYISSFHPSLHFTWEFRENSITFLNISISFTAYYLSTSVHYEPTDSHTLWYSSSHPKHTLNAISILQFLRLGRFVLTTLIFLTNVLICALSQLTDSTLSLLLTAQRTRPFLCISYGCTYS